MTEQQTRAERLKNRFRPLAETLSAEGIEILTPYLEPRQVAAGIELWREGDSGSYLAFILSGKLELLKSTEFPGRPFVLGLFSGGSLLGEDSFLDNQARQGTVKTLEAAELLILQRDNFEKLTGEQPAIANLVLKWLMNLLSARLRNTQGRLAAIF
jgi:CRP-like cAMP-binding protein